MGAQARGCPLAKPALVSALDSLRLIQLADFGGDAWWAQRRVLERLNAACHSAAGAEVVAALAARPAVLDTLVQTLLVAEGWRERVAPHLSSCPRRRALNDGARALSHGV